MGYDLHITRAEFWAENDDDYISAEEWLDLVETDAELSLNTDNGPYFAMWSGPSEYDEPWFNWWEGNVYSKFPDPKMLEKMLQIADKLDARVQGDDGEIYESTNDHPGPRQFRETNVNNEPRMLAYERREMLWNIIVYGAIAVVIVIAILLDLW